MWVEPVVSGYTLSSLRHRGRPCGQKWHATTALVHHVLQTSPVHSQPSLAIDVLSDIVRFRRWDFRFDVLNVYYPPPPDIVLKNQPGIDVFTLRSSSTSLIKLASPIEQIILYTLYHNYSYQYTKNVIIQFHAYYY